MKRQQQIKILESLNLMEKSQSSRAYARCQDEALSLCDYIDEIMQDDTQTVALLVEYCELLFKASQGESIEKKLANKLTRIIESVHSELKPTKMEIIFLPYRAAMFDALESVYLAAKDDPACDAYVIPIPYYEINTDKSLGISHYDGKLFPSNITITHWEDYDIKSRHPDVIFTHVPYDEMATNFTVHPDYYHKELRNFCGKLIYIPYFVAGTPLPYLANFAGTPGPIHSHHTILESEPVRQFYINCYKKIAKEQNATKYLGDLYEKFLSFGSPKYDKAINSKREDYTLPKSWNNIIYKPDGTRKKIVLFNTRWQAWIRSAEQYFIKMRQVFDFFSNRDDIVLWWRPHPNCEKNFRTFLPDKLNDYHSIVDEYKKGGWGIYDDTADSHRAVACTDVCYGDSSSFNRVYSVSGKPVMLQSIHVFPANDAYHTVCPQCLCVDGNSIWFFDVNINALFKHSKTTNNTEFIGLIPNHEFRGTRLVSSLLLVDKKLFMTPCASNEIIIYHTDTNKFSTISISKDIAAKKPIYNVRSKFKRSFLYKNYVFFVPASYPAIIRVNIDTHEVDYFTEWAEEVIKNWDLDAVEITRDVCVAQNDIFMLINSSNHVVIFNMDDCTHQRKKINNYNNQWDAVCYDGENYWLYASTHMIVCWNPGTNKVKEYTKFPSGIRNENFGFGFMMYVNNKCWLFPCYEGYFVVSLEPVTGDMKE